MRLAKFFYRLLMIALLAVLAYYHIGVKDGTTFSDNSSIAICNGFVRGNITCDYVFCQFDWQSI